MMLPEVRGFFRALPREPATPRRNRLRLPTSWRRDEGFLRAFPEVIALGATRQIISQGSDKEFGSPRRDGDGRHQPSCRFGADDAHVEGTGPELVRPES